MPPELVSIIWFVIWAAVILASIGLIIWLIVFTFAAKQFRRISKEFDVDYGLRRKRGSTPAERLRRRHER